MKQLILYIAMSLDGYVADTQGGVAWLDGDGSEAGSLGSYPDFYASVDTIILGYRTYEQIITELAIDAWPYVGKTCYVLTHRDLPDIHEGDKHIHFTQQPLAQLLAELADAERIWLCGGAQIAQEAIACDLIDEYRLSLIPCILGAGIPLFATAAPTRLLKLEGTSQSNGIAELRYTRR